MDESLERNREHWEELAALHPGTDFYDVEAFLEGKSSLGPLEREEVDDVTGRSLLHLQCHFGLDTLSWAREGADVVGVDFSDTAIEAAHDLTTEVGLTDRARFVVSDLYDLPERLNSEKESFDLVYTSYGVLNWLPDIEAWAEVVSTFVRPGGSFYIAEIHPVSHALMDLCLDAGTLGSAWPYFGESALEFDEEGTYADHDAAITQTTTYEWPHTLGAIVTALIDAGLVIEYLHEHPFACFEQFAGMSQRDDGFFELPGEPFPLTFSLRAHKPTAE